MRLFENAIGFSSRTAIVSNGKAFSYGDLLKASEQIATCLLGESDDLCESRVAFLVSPSFEYTAIQWGIWRAGGIAVPLCTLHPLPSIKYVLEDTGASVILADDHFIEFIRPLAKDSQIPLLGISDLMNGTSGPLPKINRDRRAMILYTSGTTSNPKGVVSLHKHIEAQIKTLVEAWEWEKEDRILNVLPLHHVHGIINVMSCALWAGACCEFLPKFDAAKVWERICSGEFSLFMGVPTMYYRLISYWEEQNETIKKEMSEAVSGLRLMVSGSAALPVSVLEKWQAISGHVLLERYGMTEIGMGLGNPYRGERRAGYVGIPFPGVEIKLVDHDFNEVSKGETGEILIKGPSVFEEYWQRPKETKEAFTSDGWFRTGDMALLHEDYYKILGRNSTDIIKSGGYKISALEIEDVLRQHPDIKDCAVVGLPDEEWGEVVAAAIISEVSIQDFDLLKVWLSKKLPAYKVPRKFLQLDELPRNVLGKVTKNKLKEILVK